MTNVRLGDLVTVTGGGTPRKSQPEYYDGKVPWVTPKDMKRRLIGESSVSITDEGVRNSSAKLIAEGSVLVVVRSGVLKHTLPVALTTAPVTLNQDMKALTPREGVDPSYLARMVKSFQSTVLTWVRATTADNFPIGNLLDLEVTLPPLAEQQRIAAIFDQADAVRTKRRRIIAYFDSLTASIFRGMFGDPLSNDRDLRQATIGSLAVVQTGNSPSRAVPDNFGDQIEWLKSDNLGADTATHADEGLSEAGMGRARIAPAGSILVTCIAGSPTSIGKSSIVDRAVAFNQQINAVLPSDAIDAMFLLGQLKTSPELVRAKSTGGMKGLVNKTAFSSIKVLAPPIRDQREFADRMRSVMRLRSASQDALVDDDELFASLQARAFQGEL